VRLLNNCLLLFFFLVRCRPLLAGLKLFIVKLKSGFGIGEALGPDNAFLIEQEHKRSYPHAVAIHEVLFGCEGQHGKGRAGVGYEFEAFLR